MWFFSKVIDVPKVPNSRHTEGPGFMQDWLCIYCSLQGGGRQGKEGLPTREFFVELSRGIAKGICQLDQFSSGVFTGWNKIPTCTARSWANEENKNWHFGGKSIFRLSRLY